jgi:hypothetical protein
VDPEETQLIEELHQIEREEHQLDTELLDVFSDVTTPEISEDEDENEDFQLDSTNNVEMEPFQIVRQRMLSAKAEPNTTVKYAWLYQNDQYKSNIRRKMKKLRNVARKADMKRIFDDQDFVDEIDRIHDNYTETGGREDLYELIALYCYIDNLNKEDSDNETDGEEEIDPVIEKTQKRNGNNDKKDDEGPEEKKAFINPVFQEISTN